METMSLVAEWAERRAAEGLATQAAKAGWEAEEEDWEAAAEESREWLAAQGIQVPVLNQLSAAAAGGPVVGGAETPEQGSQGPQSSGQGSGQGSGAQKPPLPFERLSAEASAKAASRPEPDLPVWHVRPVDVFEMDFVPKYMKGRLGLEAINAVVGGLNGALEAKYALVEANFSRLAKTDKAKVLAWREQEVDATRGRHFVLDAEVKACLPPKDAALLTKVVPILRHLTRFKEVRGKGCLRFLVNPQS